MLRRWKATREVTVVGSVFLIVLAAMIFTEFVRSHEYRFMAVGHLEALSIAPIDARLVVVGRETNPVAASLSATVPRYVSEVMVEELEDLPWHATGITAPRVIEFVTSKGDSHFLEIEWMSGQDVEWNSQGDKAAFAELGDVELSTTWNRMAMAWATIRIAVVSLVAAGIVVLLLKLAPSWYYRHLSLAEWPVGK